MESLACCHSLRRSTYRCREWQTRRKGLLAQGQEDHGDEDNEHGKHDRRNPTFTGDAVRVERATNITNQGRSMNWRRIGLGALVVGAGAAVLRRRKTQVDAGPDLDAAGPGSPAGSSSSSSSSLYPTGATQAGSGATSAVVAKESDLPTEVEAPSAGAVNAAGLSSTELITQGTADQFSSTNLLADTNAQAAPTIETSGLGNPELSPPNSDSVIMLPTMPAAGSPSIESAVARATDQVADLSDQDPMPVATVPPSPGVSTAPAAIADSPVNDAPPAQAVRGGHAPAPPPATAANGNNGSRRSFYRDHRGWSIFGSILLGLMVVAVIAASVVRLPYYSLQPGSVYDTIERVEAPGDLVSIPGGEIGFVTVSQTANITPWQWLDAKLDNNVNIRHEDEVRGDQTADELREADIRRMQVSKNSAVVVALRKLGFDLIITPIGIEVAQVFDCTAADGTLGTGDLIVGVNGVDVRSGEELVEQLMGQTVGAEVDLLIERIDPNNPTQSIGTELVAITLGSADADCLPDDVRAEEARPFIGIGTLPMFDEEFPIDIDVRTGAVSGPSAGLAFTLAIMDVLSEGELTNELSVVATGTIDRDGNVGPVGGIHQKTIAAERSGADVFIVPKCCDNFVSRNDGEPLDIPSNYDEAVLHAEDMIVIGVDTLDEALIALGELGGDVDAFIEQTTP